MAAVKQRKNTSAVDYPLKLHYLEKAGKMLCFNLICLLKLSRCAYLCRQPGTGHTWTFFSLASRCTMACLRSEFLALKLRPQTSHVKGASQGA